MIKIKFNDEMKKRIIALSMAGMTLFTAGLSGCSKKDSNNNGSITIEVADNIVDSTIKNINNTLYIVNDDMVKNTSIILLLDVLAKKDENGKISADEISKLKAKLDVDNMMDDFNAFLNILEQQMIEKQQIISISSVLPQELENNKIILSHIEQITSNIIAASNKGDKEQVVNNFNIIYKLFVKENDHIIRDLEFNVRDLGYSSRAVAEAYARTAAYYSRGFVEEKKLEAIDNRTNSQNNKAYIKTTLEILNNNLAEKSETDIEKLFAEKNSYVSSIVNGKVNLKEDDINNLVDYINLRYLDSDRVSKKDKDIQVLEYDDKKINNAILGVDAITSYNMSNDNIIPFSSFIVDNYANTKYGEIDKIALDFVQFNSIMLSKTTKEDSTFDEIYANPYFKNLYKYFTKQDFVHKYKDQNGKIIEKNITWQNISDSVNFINNEIIIYTFKKLPQSKKIHNYIEISQDNLLQSIQAIQNSIIGECKKVDYTFVKTK